MNLVRVIIILLLLIPAVCSADVAALPQDPNSLVKEYKSVTDFLHQLINSAANGEILLPDGIANTKLIFPADQQPYISRLKQWIRINGRSIFDVAADRFHELPFGRTTTGANCIYLHVFNWPADGLLTLPGLMTTPTAATILCDPNCPIGITSSDTDVILSVPDSAPDKLVTVLKLDFDRTPEIIYGPQIFPEENTFSEPIDITFSDFVVDDSYRIYYTLDGSDPNTSSTYYEEPFTLRKTAIVSCRKIAPDGKILSPVSRKKFIKK